MRSTFLTSIALALCWASITLVNVAAVDTAPPKVPTCAFSKSDRLDPTKLKSWMQDDPTNPALDFKKESDTKFTLSLPKLVNSEFTLKFEHNQLSLESQVANTDKFNHLRMIKITTTDGKITYMYSRDNHNCQSPPGGQMPTTGAKIDKVALISLKWRPKGIPEPTK